MNELIKKKKQLIFPIPCLVLNECVIQHYLLLCFSLRFIIFWSFKTSNIKKYYLRWI